MTNSKAPDVVTIDGPAGAGKSTVARAVAEKLNYSYLDTGAMYRALTFKALRQNINLEDEGALVKLAEETEIDFEGNGNFGLSVKLDGQDVSEQIRSAEVTNNTYFIARTPGVRSIMVQWQRAIGQKRNIVVEGRDVGTVVFPDAANKFYLDADFEERAARRIKELEEKGTIIDDKNLKKELMERDHKDMSREVGALKAADDAIVINSTKLSAEEVVEKIVSQIKVNG